MSAAEGDYTGGGVGRYVVSRLICCGHVGDRDSAVQADVVAEVSNTLYIWLLGRPTSGKGGQKWGTPVYGAFLLRYFAAMSTDAFVVSHSRFIVQPPPDFP